MKKLISILLALMLMALVFPSLAEPFTFPNGAQWDMRTEEVIAQEGREPDYQRELSQYLTIATYEKQIVSKYTADREYFFADDCLFLVTYEDFSSETEADLKYLKGALTSLYGESAAVSNEEIEAFMSDIAGDDSYGVSDGVQWSVNDDTTIWLFFYGNRDYIMIFYIKNSFDPSQIGLYNTTGL